MRHDANQRDAGGQLANAPAEPSANPQREECAAGPGEDFIGGQIAFSKRFAVPGGQRHRAPGYVQEKLFLAISE
jgi:hypothetical protein